jgi:hypothetical protein
MKRTLVLAISVLMTAAPLAAQHGGGAPKPKTTHGAPAPKSTTHAAPRQHGPATHGSSAPKVGKTSHSGGHAPKVAKSTSSLKTTKPPKTTKTAKTTKATKATRTSTTLAPGTALTPVQLKLQRNTNLASKLQSRLPAGTDLTLAAAGFRNLGQFVAAVNVSNNLGIPFSQLKKRMVDQGMSLGQAIQDARPKTTDTGIIVSRAETDANGLIRTTEQTTATKSKKAKNIRGGN